MFEFVYSVIKFHVYSLLWPGDRLVVARLATPSCQLEHTQHVAYRGFSRVDEGFSRGDEGFSCADEGFSRVDEGFSRVDEGTTTVFMSLHTGTCHHKRIAITVTTSLTGALVPSPSISSIQP